MNKEKLKKKVEDRIFLLRNTYENTLGILSEDIRDIILDDSILLIELLNTALNNKSLPGEKKKCPKCNSEHWYLRDQFDDIKICRNCGNKF